MTESTGEKLKILRKRAGLSIRGISEKLGIGTERYATYRANERNTKRDYLPLSLVRSLLPILVGQGNPPITAQEIYNLAGIDIGEIMKIYNIEEIKKEVCDRNIGDLLKELREERNLTIEELTKALNMDVGPSTIREIEENKLCPSWPLICSISEFYNISIDFFSLFQIASPDIAAQFIDNADEAAWLSLWRSMDKPGQREMALGILRAGILENNISARAIKRRS